MAAPRKIIQISTTVGLKEMPTISALCDDGTVWTLIPARQVGWEKLTPIPQDNDKDKIDRDDLGKFE